MAINFPDSPSTNDTVTQGDLTWIWDGTVWKLTVATALAPAGSNTQVQYNSSGAFAGSANFTFDGSAVVVKGTVTVGVDDTGHDVKFFGATSGNYMLWDESDDRLIVSGKVGIGTTAPSVPLHLNSGTDNTGILVESTDATARINIKDSSTSGNSYVGIGAVGDDMSLWAGNGKKMTILSDGKVGIGTTSPGANFQVVSENRAFSVLDSGTNNYGEAGFTSLGSDGPAYGILSAYGMLFNTGTSRGGLATRMYIHPAGDVGIGTTSPAKKLDVLDTGTAEVSIRSSSSGGDSALLFGNADDTIQASVFYDASLKSLYLRGYNNTSRLRISEYGTIWTSYVYSHTTSNAANMHIHSNGYLYRSTSSRKYKTEIEDLENDYADRVLAMRPVWYRSTTGNDPAEHSYYGLIAEEVSEIDPRLVHYGPTPDCDCPDDPDDPDAVLHTPECLTEPEGVQYDRLVPHLISVVQRQAAQIEDLSARVAALEAV